MSHGREIELKFAVPQEDLARIEAHPAFASAAGSRRQADMAATYFDTPKQDLKRNGIALRVRETDGRTIQTVKQVGASYIDRGEWEIEVADGRPALESLTDTPIGHVFRRARIARTLAPAFTVEVERTTLMLTREATRVEVAIDRGFVRSGDRTLPVSEIELELKRGDRRVMFRLARDLIADLPLTPSLVSKSERGYRLLDGSWGHPGQGRRITLDPAMSAASAFQAIGEACLHEMMLNVAAFGNGDDIEAIHRSRVALRRLRAACSLFKPIVTDAMFETLRPDLKWMSDLLGAARDLDVMQTDLSDPAAVEEGEPRGAAFAGHMRSRQLEAHAALADGLASQRWRSATNELIAWMADGPWRAASHDKTMLRTFAAARLKRRRKALVKASAHLADLYPRDRHRLRIAAKELRYGLEFFETTRKIGKHRKSYRTLQKGLELLQASLGRLHDHEFRHDLLHAEAEAWLASAGEADERAVFAAGLLVGPAIDTDDLMRRAATGVRVVKDSNPF